MVGRLRTTLTRTQIWPQKRTGTARFSHSKNGGNGDSGAAGNGEQWLHGGAVQAGGGACA
jgi:hypothetical protein